MIASRCYHPPLTASNSCELGLHICRPLQARTAAARNSRAVRSVPCQVQHNSDGPASDGDVEFSSGLKRPKWPQQHSPQHSNSTSSSQGPKRSKPALGSSNAGGKPAAKDQHGSSDSGAGGAAVGRAGGQHNSKSRPGQPSARRPTRTTPHEDSPQQQKQTQRPSRTDSTAAKPWVKGKGQGRVSPPLLTAWLRAATSPEQLLQLLQQHAADLNHIHLSAAYTQAVRVCRHGGNAAKQQVLSELHQLSMRLQQQCGARQLANIIWSCGKLSSPTAAQLLLPLFLQTSTLQ